MRHKIFIAHIVRHQLTHTVHISRPGNRRQQTFSWFRFIAWILVAIFIATVMVILAFNSHPSVLPY